MLSDSSEWTDCIFSSQIRVKENFRTVFATGNDLTSHSALFPTGPDSRFVTLDYILCSQELYIVPKNIVSSNLVLLNYMNFIQCEFGATNTFH